MTYGLEVLSALLVHHVRAITQFPDEKQETPTSARYTSEARRSRRHADALRYCRTVIKAGQSCRY